MPVAHPEEFRRRAVELARQPDSKIAVNELWLTDISEHPTSEGKLYLCAVNDVFSGRILSCSTDA